MQQQSQQTMKTPPLFPSSTPIPTPITITTDEVQKYLDDNKNLILAIMENQNLGKIAECAQYQAQLQKNLMYLAAIADAQPQAPTMPSQTPLQSAVQQEHHPQQPQSAATAQQQQPSASNPKLPFQLNALHPRDQQQLLFQQQQLMQGQMGMRPPAAHTSMHQAMQSGFGNAGSLVDTRGTKQDLLETGSGGNQGNSASGRGSGDRDSQH